MMHRVPRNRLTAPAVAGQLERGVRPHLSRSEDRVALGAAKAVRCRRRRRRLGQVELLDQRERLTPRSKLEGWSRRG